MSSGRSRRPPLRLVSRGCGASPRSDRPRPRMCFEAGQGGASFSLCRGCGAVRTRRRLNKHCPPYRQLSQVSGHEAVWKVRCRARVIERIAAGEFVRVSKASEGTSTSSRRTPVGFSETAIALGKDRPCCLASSGNHSRVTRRDRLKRPPSGVLYRGHGVTANGHPSVCTSGMSG